MGGFLGNGEAMFEQADQEAIQWECFLLVLDDEFKGESFRVTDIVEKLARTCSDDNRRSSRLRKRPPDFLAEVQTELIDFFSGATREVLRGATRPAFGETQVFVTFRARARSEKPRYSAGRL